MDKIFIIAFMAIRIAAMPYDSNYSIVKNIYRNNPIGQAMYDVANEGWNEGILVKETPVPVPVIIDGHTVDKTYCVYMIHIGVKDTAKRFIAYGTPDGDAFIMYVDGNEYPIDIWNEDILWTDDIYGDQQEF